MHRVGMVKVRSVNDILDVSLVLVPHVLLLHDFLERIREILIICLVLHHFVQSRI